MGTRILTSALLLLGLSCGAYAGDHGRDYAVFAYFAVPLDGPSRSARSPFAGFRTDRRETGAAGALETDTLADFRVNARGDHALLVDGRPVEFVENSDDDR